MKTKKIKTILVIFTILTCLCTICFATDSTNDVPQALNSEEVENNNDVDANAEEENTDADTDTDSDADATTDVEAHEGDLFLTGTTINLDQVVNGSAYVFGTDVTITGQINGDLFVIASNSLAIENGSMVYGNAFVASPKISFDGIVYGLYALADTFTCEYNGMSALDVKVLANTIDFSGYIERHVYLAAKNLTLQDDACVLGNLNYSASNVNISDNATISGETYASTYSATDTPGKVVAQYVINFIATLTLLLIAFLAILLVKPSIVQNASTHLTEKPLRTFGLGILTLIVVPILAAICFAVKVLTSVALLLVILYIILLILSTVVVTIGLAKYIDNKIQKTKSSNSILAYILIVAVVLWALAQIPYVGILVSLLILIFGLGTIVVSLVSTKKTEKVEKVKEEVKAEQPKVEEPKKEENKDNKDDNKDKPEGK